MSYVTEKDGTVVWVGPSREEVALWRLRAETCRLALESIVAISHQGSVCEVANKALEKTR